MNEHFSDQKVTHDLKEHYFGQLHLDLEWATEAAIIFAERDGADAITSISCGFNAIAGRRWNRFKEAEKDGNENRASEMKTFAQFWYRVAKEIEQRKEENDHTA